MQFLKTKYVGEIWYILLFMFMFNLDALNKLDALNVIQSPPLFELDSNIANTANNSPKSLPNLNYINEANSLENLFDNSKLSP